MAIEEKPDKKKANHEFDREKTIDFVTELILEHLPTATSDRAKYLKVNKEFVDQITKKKDISTQLSKHCFQVCPKCSGKIVKWAHQTKDSFIISLSEIKRIVINVHYCQKCEILLYPCLFNVGLLPLHNKEWIKLLYEISQKRLTTFYIIQENFIDLDSVSNFL